MQAGTEARAAEFQTVEIGQLEESKTNPRKHFAKDALSDLTESIREKGVLVPLLVRKYGTPNGNEFAKQHFEILAGARRFRAAKAAGLKEIPVLIRDLDDEQALEVQVIENLQRQDVHPLEEAEGYKQLLAKGKYEIESLASKVGKSVSYVYQRLKLAELVPSIKKAFQGEKLTPGHAILLARLQPKDQEKAWKDSRRYNGTVSVRELARWIQENLHLALKAACFPTDDSQKSSDFKSSELVKGAVACIACPKRSGANPQLFSDIKGEDICTDPHCFHAKEQKFVELQVYVNPGAKELSVGSFYGNPKPKGLVNWTPVKKECKDTVKGVVAEIAQYHHGEEKLGQLLAVCTNARCKVHHPKAAKMVPRNHSGDSKKYEEQRQLREKADSLVFSEIIRHAKTQKELPLEDARFIAAAFSDNFYDVGEEIPELFGLKGAGYAQPKHLAKLNRSELNAFMLAAALSVDTRLDEVAKRHKVDVKAIRKEIESKAKEEAKAKKKAKPAKVQTPAKPAKKGKKAA